MKIKQRNFLIAWENKRLVAGALKSAHIWPNYANYEDLLQEGICLYAHMLESHPELSQKDIDRLSFRKIIWYTTDHLRRLQRFNEHNCQLVNAINVGIIFNWDELIVLQQEMDQMTQVERVIFQEHLIAGKTLKSLTTECDLTRVQLQRVKRKLLCRLRQTLAEDY
ncbi:sigma-70 family RNA polymerase sigma factor [Lactobacillus sp. ESL0791]|uniref:sigma-70 family RNA polymerase sigma factor n=1 Tax=Lactobacillus sp. ESL0791 TaxID=2983234 RepID=UPI0023F84ADB|nr:sigma-70 family RNA polymerase sigma factor [Lactobacillus sp. ESL0791]MDF7638185.1 sigma-70 family RNA polymerase sigma factor [Lactobacillus sp. ESL0791]